MFSIPCMEIELRTYSHQRTIRTTLKITHRDERFCSALLHRTLSRDDDDDDDERKLRRNTIKCTGNFCDLLHFQCVLRRRIVKAFDRTAAAAAADGFSNISPRELSNFPQNTPYFPVWTTVAVTATERGREHAQKLARLTRKAVCELLQEEKSWWRICVPPI